MQDHASMIMQPDLQDLLKLELRIIKTLNMMIIIIIMITNQIYRIICKKIRNRSFGCKTMLYMALPSVEFMTLLLIVLHYTTGHM